MPNRNKLVRIFIGNAANAVVHKILEKAIEEENLRKYYEKEVHNSFLIAKKYRNLINPVSRALPESEEIKADIVKKARQELNIRIKKGYKNIDMDSVSSAAEKLLKKLKANKA